VKSPAIVFAIFVALLGAWLANEAIYLYPRFVHLPDSVDSQAAILERRPFVFEGIANDYPVWRHRVVMPLLLKGLSHFTPLSPSQSYLAMRWLTACLALAAFGWLLREHLLASPWFVAPGLGLFALVLGPSFLHIYDIPSDFLDAAAMALLTLFAFQKRPAAFLIVFLPALLNREGAIFALPLWAALHAGPVRTAWRSPALVFPAAAGLLGIVLVRGLRQWNALPVAAPADHALQPLIPWETHVDQFITNLAHPHPGNPLYYLLGFGALFGLLLRQNWACLTADERRLAFIAVAVAFFSMLFGNIIELRTQMAGLVWFSFLALVIIHRRLFPSRL
jgi:hypothetical protein